jgi:hypothetical protein
MLSGDNDSYVSSGDVGGRGVLLYEHLLMAQDTDDNARRTKLK